MRISLRHLSRVGPSLVMTNRKFRLRRSIAIWRRVLLCVAPIVREPLPLLLAVLGGGGFTWTIGARQTLAASTLLQAYLIACRVRTRPWLISSRGVADHLTTPRRIGDCDASGRRLGQPSRRLLRGHRPPSRWFPRRIMAWARVGVRRAGHSRAARRGLRIRPRRPSDVIHSWERGARRDRDVRMPPHAGTGRALIPTLPWALGERVQPRLFRTALEARQHHTAQAVT